MNLAAIGAVFAIIFVGELPDKTMVASVVMSTRGHPFAVWLGSAGAFLVHVVIATTLGTVVFHLLAPRVVDAVVAVIFLVGAGLTAVPSRLRLPLDRHLLNSGGWANRLETSWRPP